MTYEQIIEDLCQLHELRAFHETSRIRTEVTTVHTHLEAGAAVAATERLARFYALEDIIAVVEIDAKIAALMLRKELVERTGRG